MKMLISVQYLRGCAALLVVLHHASINESWLYNPVLGWGFGATGVDIFFVISGFVMYHVARNEKCAEFLLKRAIRIVPMYWIATIAYTGLLAIGKFGGLSDIWHVQLLKSLFFIPHWSPKYDHQVWPLLIVGWTLNYEVFFYFVFAVGILLKRILEFVTFVMVGLVALGLLFGPFENPIAITYTSPLLLEFLAGIYLARFVSSPTLRGFEAAMPIGFGMLAVGSMPTFPYSLRVWVLMIGAISVVSGAIAFELRRGVKSRRLPKLIGDASYSIYLTHPFVIILVFKVWQRVALEGWPQFLSLLLATVIASTVVGVLIHLFLERPITNMLRRRIPDGQSPAIRT
jgi:exopolysaccharide production protein ExoZ